jgi:hypothetical protein
MRRIRSLWALDNAVFGDSLNSRFYLVTLFVVYPLPPSFDHVTDTGNENTPQDTVEHVKKKAQAAQMCDESRADEHDKRKRRDKEWTQKDWMRKISLSKLIRRDNRQNKGRNQKMPKRNE